MKIIVYYISLLSIKDPFDVYYNIASSLVLDQTYTYLSLENVIQEYLIALV